VKDQKEVIIVGIDTSILILLQDRLTIELMESETFNHFIHLVERGIDKVLPNRR
jgi:hypothetical protein